jgi:hypothetical protein
MAGRTGSWRRTLFWTGTTLLTAACSGPGGGAPSPSAPAGPLETPSRLEFVPELFVDPEARPDEGAPPLRVRFAANVEDATGEVDCEWDFGDGSPKVREKDPTHVYERVGDYEAVAVCRDEIGTEGEGETDVFVEPDEAAGSTPP